MRSCMDTCSKCGALFKASHCNICKTEVLRSNYKPPTLDRNKPWQNRQVNRKK